MPFYDYICDTCHFHFDDWKSMIAPCPPCPQCTGTTHKIPSRPSRIDGGVTPIFYPGRATT